MFCTPSFDEMTDLTPYFNHVIPAYAGIQAVSHSANQVEETSETGSSTLFYWVLLWILLGIWRLIEKKRAEDSKIKQVFGMVGKLNERQTEAGLREAGRIGRLMEGTQYPQGRSETVGEMYDRLFGQSDKEDDELINRAWKSPAIRELLDARGLGRDGLKDIIVNLQLAGSGLYVAEQVVSNADLLGEYFQLVGEIVDPDNPTFKWATAQLVVRVRGQQ